MPDAKISLDPGIFTEEVFREASSEKLEPSCVVCFYLYSAGNSDSTGVFEPKISTLTYNALPGKVSQDGMKIYKYLLDNNKYLEFIASNGKRYTYIPAYLKINTLNHPRKPILPFPPKDWLLDAHYAIAKKWGIDLDKMKTRKPQKELTIFDDDNMGNGAEGNGKKDTPVAEKAVENKDTVVPEKKESVPEKPDEKKESPSVKEEKNPMDNTNEIIDAIVSLWNKTNLKHVTKITDTRKSKIKTRLKEKEFIDGWETAILKMSESNLCLEAGWATMDFLIDNSNNYIKVLEGKYDNPGVRKVELSANKRPDIKDYGNLSDPRMRVKAYQEDMKKWVEKYGDKK